MHGDFWRTPKVDKTIVTLSLIVPSTCDKVFTSTCVGQRSTTFPLQVPFCVLVPTPLPFFVPLPVEAIYLGVFFVFFGSFFRFGRKERKTDRKETRSQGARVP